MMISLAIWGIGLLLKLNEVLSRASRNNLVGNKQGWENWEGRVVLITGGESDLHSGWRNLGNLSLNSLISIYRCWWIGKGSCKAIESERFED